MTGSKGRSGGHNRKTDAQKKLAGTFRKDRATPTVDEQPLSPRIPSWFKSDPIAIESWKRLVAMMLEARTILPADRDAIALAAKAESEYRRADEILLTAGLTVATGNGVVAHPAVRIRESAWRRWHSALAALGLHPVGRERVPKSKPATVAPGKTGNRFADV